LGKPNKRCETKAIQSQDKCVRLLHLVDSFTELDWCTKGHIGYVLKGEMILDFIGHKVNYRLRDAFIIKEGETSKHKAIVEYGKFVKLLLLE